MRKTVLITGCSSGGLGNAFAREYAARVNIPSAILREYTGLHVFATARRLESMKDLVDLSNVTLLPLDVTNADSILQLVKTVEGKLDGAGLDMLVNNAGIANILPAADMPIEASKAMIDTNLLGPIMMVKEFLSLLIKSGDACVLNVGSAAGTVPIIGATYNSTKAALRMYSETIRIELAPFNIHAMHLIIGRVYTRIWNHLDETLPADSLYSPIATTYIGARNTDETNSVSAEEYARKIVRVSLRPRPPAEFYVAPWSIRAWIMRLLPIWVSCFILSYGFGFNRLAHLRSKERKTA